MSPASSSLAPPLNDEIYSRLQDLIHVRTGLIFSDHQRASVIKEIKHAGADTPEQYYSLLCTKPINAACWDDLINALTICETYFFRDSDQMQMLRKYIIPDLLARHCNDHTLRLWSAGCATGEEAYTLAMLLRYLIPDIERWKITILATDINKHALEKAQRGHYLDWSFRQQAADDPLVLTYFTQDYSGYQIHSSIKPMVHFACLNLSEDSFPSSLNMTDHLDLILCRNVTMYLSETVIQQLARRFYECLLPGGWLMLAACENNDQIYYQFKTLLYEKAIVYQKVMSSPLPPPPQPNPAFCPAQPPPQTLPAANPLYIQHPPANLQPMHPKNFTRWAWLLSMSTNLKKLKNACWNILPSTRRMWMSNTSLPSSKPIQDTWKKRSLWLSRSLIKIPFLAKHIPFWPWFIRKRES